MDTNKELLIKVMTGVLAICISFCFTACKKSSNYAENDAIDFLFFEWDDKRESVIVDCFITNEGGNCCDIRVYNDGWMRIMVTSTTYKELMDENWHGDTICQKARAERIYQQEVQLEERKLTDTDFSEIKKMVDYNSGLPYIRDIDACGTSLVIMYFPGKDKVFRFCSVDDIPLNELKEKLAKLANYNDRKYLGL